MQHECRRRPRCSRSTRRSILRIPSQVPAPALGREIPFAQANPSAGRFLPPDKRAILRGNVGRYQPVCLTALQGRSIMHKWTNDKQMMITCCDDGTRPVIFKIERIDIPETEEERKGKEREWLAKQNFTNTAEKRTCPLAGSAATCLHRLWE